MNGGIVVTGQLITRLNFPLTLDAINVSRYGNQTSGSQLAKATFPGFSATAGGSINQ
jgi:hypoxanthine phosphoribosyltransferase